MSNRFRRTAALLATLMFVPPALAADWPQWRGQDRDGKSAETGLLRSWPEDGPALAWSAEGIGAGFSSVAVADARIYTLGDLGDAQYALGLEREDGTILWKTKIGPAWKDEYLGPRSTPTVDGDRVYVLSTEGVLYCLDAAKGTPLWQKDLVEAYGASMMKAKGTYDWKFSESPLVDGDRVFVTPGTKDAALVALDKKTGKEIWRSKIPGLGEKGEDGAAYSSIVISEAGGIKHYVQFVGRGLIGVDADSGRFLWGYNPIANGVANIATPLIDGSLVFASSGYGTGSALVELTASDGNLSVKERYFLGPEEMQNHHGGLILHGGDVYTGTGHNKGLPISVDLATGKNNWGPVRNDGQASAAIAYADERLYFRYQNGLMVLVEATPEEYREHGSFMIPGVKHPSWAHPVIADGKLYLREQEKLYCYDIKRPS